MTNLPPDVLAETARSTATTYHFRSPPCTTSRVGGWALCTVNDTTGELLIQSDWTEACGHRWPVDSLGRPTLTDFLAGAHFDYLVDKLLPPERRKRFCPESTVKHMRCLVVERRKLGGISRGGARELWDALGELISIDDSRDFLTHLNGDTDYCEHFDDVYEDLREVPTSDAHALATIILPALVEACRREVERRRLPSAHGPQPAAGAVA